MLHKRKKSVDELMKYRVVNTTSTVVGRRAKGLKTLCDFPVSPRDEQQTLSSPTSPSKRKRDCGYNNIVASPQQRLANRRLRESMPKSMPSGNQRALSNEFQVIGIR